jgi:D-alanyl-D-alanine carboxypeptidase
VIDLRTEAVLQAALDRERQKSGAFGVTAAVRCEGLGAWTGASGSLDLAGKQAMPAGARLPAYSITKTMTAVCLLRLAESTALDLQDSIARWLPELPWGADVSLLQLLNHTAGVPNYSVVPEQVAAVASSPGQAWQFDEFIAHSCNRGLEFAPGDGWGYSNTGYMLLKRVVEESNGSSFTRAIQQHVTGPLGQVDTAVIEDRASLLGLAPGYSRSFSQDGRWQDIRAIYDPGWCATGVVASTAADLCEFYHSLFSGKLVYHESLSRMTELVRMPGEHPPAVSPSYGLGLMGDPDGAHGPEFGHGGGGPGYDLRASCYPQFKDRRVTAAVLCNSDEVDAWSALRGVLDALEPELGDTLRLS